jgi:NH3-dependent NAD+ synthetase
VKVITIKIGVADIQLINDLHKSEVFAVGRELGVPQEILDAPPSADLWDDQTDENELGTHFFSFTPTPPFFFVESPQ